MAEKGVPDKEASEEEAVIPLKGLVVNWSLPSRATLQDWLRLDHPEIRIREVVELFPEEVFKELDTIRRGFYRAVERLIVPAYTLKLLPIDSLPKLHDAIDKTRVRLKGLDVMIEEAAKSEYFAKAKKYYEETAGQSPRITSEVAGRFSVMMIPLRLDPIVWDEFLTEEMKVQQERMDRRFDDDKAFYDKRLEGLKAELESQVKVLEVKQADVAAAEAEVEEAFGGVTASVDIVALRAQRAELQEAVKGLKAQVREGQRSLERIQRDRKESTQNFQRSARWARRETEATERAMTFDVKKLWMDTLEGLAKKAVESFELSDKKRRKVLATTLETAQATVDRIYSLQPGSFLIKSYERLIEALGQALSGDLGVALKSLEDLT